MARKDNSLQFHFSYFREIWKEGTEEQFPVAHLKNQENSKDFILCTGTQPQTKLRKQSYHCQTKQARGLSHTQPRPADEQNGARVKKRPAY